MQFISLIRFDVICVIVFLCTVVLGLIRNQTKCWIRTISFILAVGLVGCFVYFNWFNGAAFVLGFLDKYVFVPVCNFMKFGEGYKEVFAILVILIAIFIVELLFVGILRLFGAGGKYKYKKYPSYATIHRPIVGMISGIIRGLVNVYVIYIFWSFLIAIKGISVEGDLLYGLILKFDPVVAKLKELIGSFLGA